MPPKDYYSARDSYGRAKAAIQELTTDLPLAPTKEDRTAFQRKLLSYIKGGDGVFISPRTDGTLSIGIHMDPINETLQSLVEANYHLHRRVDALMEEIKDLKDEVFND